MTQVEQSLSEVRGFEIEAASEIPFPKSLAVGEGTPLLIGGWCRPLSGKERIRRIEVAVDGHRSESMSYGLPRKDVYRDALAAGAGKREAMSAFRSGFAAIGEVPPSAAGRTVEVEVIAHGTSGSVAVEKLGDLTLLPNPGPAEEMPWPEGEAGPRVAICMATYSPDPERFKSQIDSIKAQTHGNWVCLISDDASSDESLALIEQVVEGDPRFSVSACDGRLGFYSNFERALELVPGSAELIALADQDDRWQPDKLETLIKAVEPGQVQLAYSDARVVSDDGSLIHPSYWSVGRRNNHTNLASLIICNSVTGAASIFKPAVLRLALPFPHTPVNSFHDHWIACVALAVGEISYVDRPLYDYIQHQEAVIGFDGAMAGVSRTRARPLRSFLGTLRDITIRDSTDPGKTAASRLLPMDYYFGSTRLTVLAAALTFRCRQFMTGSKYRSARRLATADQESLSFLYLLARRYRRFIGLNETTDIERTRAKGLLWRRMIQLRAKLERNPERVSSDARVPLLQEAVPGEAARL